MANYSDSLTYSTASGVEGLQYVVLQVTLKEKFLGTGSGNLSALEEVLNEQASKGYRRTPSRQPLHKVADFWAATGFRQRWYLKK